MYSDCVIEPTRKPPIYYVGEYVIGSVLLTTERTKIVQDAFLNLMGFSKVRFEKAVEGWRLSLNRSRRRRTIYKSKQTFCHVITRLPDGVYRPGVYMFDFIFKLNKECLTSYEGAMGYVRYEILLILERTNQYDNIFKKAITVIKHNDLNKEPSFRFPPETVRSNGAQCSCLCNFSRGKAFFTLDMPFKAYTPGQRLRYTVTMHNKRAGKITDVFVRLMKRVTYTSTQPRQIERHTKTELLFRYFPGDRITDDVVEDNFMIPSTTPTGTDREMIYVHYYLKARMEYSCCVSYNLSAKQEIIIGTVPVKESLHPSQFLSNGQYVPGLQGEYRKHPDIKPPTYAMDFPCSAHFIDYDFPPINRIVGFRPYYPMYKLPNEIY